MRRDRFRDRSDDGRGSPNRRRRRTASRRFVGRSARARRPRGAGHHRRPVIRARLPGRARLSRLPRGRQARADLSPPNPRRACGAVASDVGPGPKGYHTVSASSPRPGRRAHRPFPVRPQRPDHDAPCRSEPAQAAHCAAPVRRPERASAEAEGRHPVPSLSIGARPRPAGADAARSVTRLIGRVGGAGARNAGRWDEGISRRSYQIRRQPRYTSLVAYDAGSGRSAQASARAAAGRDSNAASLHDRVV